jgi:hypothetical protein
MTILDFIDRHPWWSFFALLVVGQTLYGIAHALGGRKGESNG